MLKPVRDTETLKRYSQPPRALVDQDQGLSGTISTFPSSPLDVPTATFESNLKRRQENHQKLILWIKQNLLAGIHYGRIHENQQCPYAKAGMPQLCSDFSHFSMMTLWKPGAEMILSALGLSVYYPNLFQYELACVHRQEITTIVLKCELKAQNGKIVGEGIGARHIRQDNWNLNTSLKMAAKSAMVDATIKITGLSGVFRKTHQNTLTRIGDCNFNNLPEGGNCNGTHSSEKSITQKQKDCINRVSGLRGYTTDSLNRLIKEQFSKAMDDLTRVEASRLIQNLNHING
jgi:hypothetical protein